jgi:hypothetical protein
MVGYKLRDRVEHMEWNPPLLSFHIERHGATVMGSTRAEIQQWEVDVGKGTATLVGFGMRQLYPMDQRLNVRPIADEIAAIIVSGKEDERVRRKGKTVTVLTGKIIPATNRQTTAARRKRLAQELERLLIAKGWRRTSKTGNLTFEPL